MQISALSLFRLCNLRRGSALLIVTLLVLPAAAHAKTPKPTLVPDPSIIAPASANGVTVQCLRLNATTAIAAKITTKKKKTYALTYQTLLNDAAAKLAKAKKKKIPKAQAAYNAALVAQQTFDGICLTLVVPPGASLKPLAGVPDPAQTRYLLNKVAYGADFVTQPLVDNAQRLSMTDLVNQLFTIRSEDASFMSRANDRLDEQPGVANNDNSLTFRGQRQAWLDRQVNTRNPVYYRLHQCYLGLWTTGVKVITERSNLTPLWQNYSEMLLNAAAADVPLPDLVLAMSRDPMMLFYLNNGDNIKGSPNENFARELQELFTIGTHQLTEVNGVAALDLTKPNYVEFRTGADGNPDQTLGDIRTIARRLTGFRLSQLRGPDGTLQWRGVYSLADHEAGPETIYAGMPYAFSADNDEDVIRGIFEHHPAAAPFLALQLIKCFGTEKPPLALVQSVAKSLKDNGWRPIETLKQYFSSEAFQATASQRGLTLAPDILAVSFIRSTGLSPQSRFDPANQGSEFGVNVPSIVDRLYQRLGYGLNDPDTVFWYFPDTFVAPGALLNSANLYDALVTDSTSYNRITWNALDALGTRGMNGEATVRAIAARLAVPLTLDQVAGFTYYLNNDFNSNGSVTSRPYEGRTEANQLTKLRSVTTLIAMLPAYAIK